MHAIPQSWSHLHILIGVFPSFGLLIALCFLVAGNRSGNDRTQRTCLALIGLLALLSVPIYLSGNGSMAVLSKNAGFPKDIMASHYGWGLAALAALAVTGLAAWFELWRSRGGGKISAGYLVAGLAVISLALSVVAGEIGFGIDHRELFSTTVIPDVSTSPLWPQAHLVLNHVPTAGFVFALFFYLVALVTKNDGMTRGGLVLFAVCCIIGVPTYVSGTAAMWALTQPPVPGISKAVINAHRDMALWTLFGLAFTGSAAWLELWRSRYFGRFSRLSLGLVLLFALVTLGVMTETGHRGGLINHPEIRTALDALPTDPNVGITPAVEQEMSEKRWFVAWQIVHFFGFCLIFGSVLAVGLRVLGFWKAPSFAAVHRLLPIGWLGVIMNIVSGMLMMLSDSYRYVVGDITFAPKMAFIAIGAVAVLYYSTSERLWKVKAGESAPAGAKWVTVLVLVAWAGVIVCGRLLAYV